MAAYLPVPVTAVHTTNIDYCVGEGLISRFTIDNSEGTPAKDIQTDGTLGRYIRLLGYLMEIDIPSGVTGLTAGAFLWNPASINAQPYDVIDFLNASSSVLLRLERQASGILTLKRGTTTLASTTSVLDGTPRHFEFTVEFDDTSGLFKMKINAESVPEINFSGDTLNAAGPVTKMRIRSRPRAVEVIRLAIAHGYVRARDGTDNFYGRGISKYFPYTDDVSVQFTPTGTGTNNNDRIEETDPDGDTTRVSSSTDGHEDTYGPPDASAVSGAVKCLWNYQGSKQDGSALLHSVITPDGGSKDVETNGRLVPFSTYGGVATAYETVPGTSNPWSGANISAIDAIGFQLEVP